MNNREILDNLTNRVIAVKHVIYFLESQLINIPNIDSSIMEELENAKLSANDTGKSAGFYSLVEYVKSSTNDTERSSRVRLLIEYVRSNSILDI